MKQEKAIMFVDNKCWLLRRSQDHSDSDFCDEYPDFMIDLSDTISENLRDLQNMIDFWERCTHPENFSEDKLNECGECTNVCCSYGRAVVQKELNRLNGQTEMFIM